MINRLVSMQMSLFVAAPFERKLIFSISPIKQFSCSNSKHGMLESIDTIQERAKEIIM